MSERKMLLRAFFLSFFTTLIITLFILNLFWVDMRAKANGFSGFPPAFELEQSGELQYRAIIAGREARLDLTPLDNAAGLLQRAGRWCLPQGWRRLSRLGLFTAGRIKAGSREAREKEFYKNAGLV